MAQRHSHIVPARLAFLAIYNPSLGPTDDTFQDQVVFYHSGAAHEARAAAKEARRDNDGDDDDASVAADTAQEEENEKLRQIGLAQGMVDFARSFSGGEPVDSIETEKSRIVLHELEKGWWILASVDLTRLPAFAHSPSEKRGAESAETKSTTEYSAREVSPAPLLLQQLLEAHGIFRLHYGPSLTELYVRLTRDKFCSALERFWARFARSWDVLLHGNPAADVFNGLKLASGGELGFGVGEEEWGSGERAVLEDFAHRTEGLVDLLVSRFGETAPVEWDGERSSPAERDGLPWLGSGSQPLASDGVIFSGIGSVARPSLRDISLWMRQIYTYGEYAHGVRDNPLRERRKRRRRQPAKPANGGVDKLQSLSRRNPGSRSLRQAVQQKETAKQKDDNQRSYLELLPKDARPEIYPRVASRDHATTPEDTPTPLHSPHSNIPPPIATAAQLALEQATRKTDGRRLDDGEADPGMTLGIPDQYMKYLTLGLSTLGKPSAKKTLPVSEGAPRASPKTKQAAKVERSVGSRETEELDEDDPMLTHLEPMPDGETIKSKIATQKHEENRGQFVIGLKGGLEQEATDEEDGHTDGGPESDPDASRIVLRTLHVELLPAKDREEESDALSRRRSVAGIEFPNEATNNFKRVRVLVYIRRPFMFCFLFEGRTSSLQWPRFYKSLHRSLAPIHRPLLSSTSTANVTRRIESANAVLFDRESTSPSDPTKQSPKSAAATATTPIYELIFDPRLLTLHTSIPNIPEPGTPAAEGILPPGSKESMPSPWTRMDALNVHSQILNTVASVKGKRREIERTNKTTRGWWVVWMKFPPSPTPPPEPPFRHEDTEDSDRTVTAAALAFRRASSSVTATTTITTQPPDPASTNNPVDTHRVAFLVRRAPDASGPASKSPSAGSMAMMSNMLNTMSLGLAGGGGGGGGTQREDETTGGANAGWGPAALAGGIGVDARKYLEALLSLNR